MISKANLVTLINAINLTTKINYFNNCKNSFHCHCYDETIICRNSNITRIPLIENLTFNSYKKTIKLFQTQLQLVQFRQKKHYAKLKKFIVVVSNLKSLSIDEFLPSASFLKVLIIAKSQLRNFNTIKAKQMKALRIISTPHNLLTSVPRFNRFTNIRIINLSHNRLSKVKAGNFPATVVQLDLSNNKIRCFLTNKSRKYHFARRYKKLQILNLHGNKLHKFTLEAIPRGLKLLNLSNSNLKHIELTSKYLNSNFILDLRNNPIRCTCKFLHQYLMMLIQNTIKLKCEDKGCLKCAYLNKSLGLNQSQIQEISTKVCSSIKRSTTTVYIPSVISKNSTYHIKVETQTSKVTKVVVVLISIVIGLLSVLIISFYRLKNKISNT